jgi:hypothetical protein
MELLDKVRTLKWNQTVASTGPTKTDTAINFSQLFQNMVRQAQRISLLTTRTLTYFVQHYPMTFQQMLLSDVSFQQNRSAPFNLITTASMVCELLAQFFLPLATDRHSTGGATQNFTRSSRQDSKSGYFRKGSVVDYRRQSRKLSRSISASFLPTQAILAQNELLEILFEPNAFYEICCTGFTLGFNKHMAAICEDPKCDTVAVQAEMHEQLLKTIKSHPHSVADLKATCLIRTYSKSISSMHISPSQTTSYKLADSTAAPKILLAHSRSARQYKENDKEEGIELMEIQNSITTLRSKPSGSYGALGDRTEKKLQNFFGEHFDVSQTIYEQRLHGRSLP